MRWFRYAALVVIVTVLQASFLDSIAVTSLNIKPDLLLTLMVFFSIYGVSTHRRTRLSPRAADLTDVIITSFTLGLAADIIGPDMGPRMVSFGLLGSLLAYLHHIIATRRMLYQSFEIFVAALMVGFMVRLLTTLKGQPAVTFPVILWTSVYSAIVGPFVFLPSAWWMRIETQRTARH